MIPHCNRCRLSSYAEVHQNPAHPQFHQLEAEVLIPGRLPPELDNMPPGTPTVVSVPPIPDHVAAYAAALGHYCSSSWADIAGFCRKIGLGVYDAGRLQRAAEIWAACHVSPEAIEIIRKRRRKRT